MITRRSNFLVVATVAAGIGCLSISSCIEARAQNAVPCWPVPNGLNTTIACANGFWHTTTPEGDVYTGNGGTDPSASARGSGIITDSGGNITLRGQTVTPPTQILPMLEPYQANQYGFMPRQD